MEDFEKSETGHERIPSREEVLTKIGSRCERPEVVRELADERGPYLLEMRSAEGEPSEATLFVYQRKGTFPDGNEAAATVIEAVYFSDGGPCGGDIVAEYDEAKGEWVEK